MAGIVPIGVFSSLLMVLVWNQQQTQVQQALQGTARAVAIAVDRELESTIERLQILSRSPLLRPSMLEEFYHEAQQVLASDPKWNNIILLDTEGHQLINLHALFGTRLPTSGDRAHFQTVLQTLKPVISDLFTPRVADSPRAGAGMRQAIYVLVPVIQSGRLAFVLSASLELSGFEKLLQAQDAAKDGVTAIFDRNLRFVARSKSSQQFLGMPPIAPLHAAMQEQDSGTGRFPRYDGSPVYSAWSRAPSSRWTVTIGQPAAPTEAALRRSLWLLGGTGIALLLFGIIIALLLGGRVASAISAAAEAAMRLAEGRPVPPVRATVREIVALGSALKQSAALLDQASERRAEAERERNLLLEREQEARARAEAANRAKDEFLAMLGHELRNPLGAIRTAVHVLSEVGSQAPDTDRIRDIIKRQTAQLAKLTDDLLDVARVVTGRISLQLMPVNLAEMVAHAAETLASSEKAHAHEIIVETRPVWLEADPTRIEQIIVNLMSNAIKYTPAGGHIRVTAACEGNEAVLCVADDGAGISPELLPRIFDLFVQGERTIERSQGGLGIGLTLVRRLVELHHGVITVQSDGPGKGSTFTVRLPCIEPPAAIVPAPAPTVTSPRRVFLVEDNEDAREMLRDFLRLHGYEVHEAADGIAAVEEAPRIRPDIALVDIGLPGIDGYEVARRLRSDPALGHTALVALSGYGLPEDRARASEAGFDRHLIKPVDPMRLMELIDELTRKREQDAS